MAAPQEYRLVDLSPDEAFWQLGLFLVDDNRYVMGNMIIRLLSEGSIEVTKRIGANVAGAEKSVIVEELTHTIGDQEFLICDVAGQLLVKKKVPIIIHKAE